MCQSLCVDFAQSYLKTIASKYAAENQLKRQLAIDIETELYNICLLDLSSDSLKNYQPKAFEKYKDF